MKLLDAVDYDDVGGGFGGDCSGVVVVDDGDLDISNLVVVVGVATSKDQTMIVNRKNPVGIDERYCCCCCYWWYL